MRRFTLLLIIPAMAIARGEDLKTTDGKEFKNVTVSRVEPDGLMIVTDSGILKLFFVELPKDVQEKYHYDPQQAAAFRARLDAANTTAKQTVAEVKERQRNAFIQNAEASQASQKAWKETVSASQSYDNPLNHVAEEKWAINGKVLSVTNEGALIFCQYSGFGMKTPKDEEAVFVKGKEAAELVDDQVVKCVGTPNGTYQYNSAGNAAKTVRSFDLVGRITSVP
jgi:hypothetical protein